MTTKQGHAANTEFRSRNYLLFVCLIFSAVIFVAAAQIKWVPYLNSSSSAKDSTDLLQGVSLHKGTTHVSSPSKPTPPDQPPSLDSPRDNSGDDSMEDDPVNQHGYDPLSTQAPTAPTVPATTLNNPSQLGSNKERNPFLTIFPPRPPAEGEKFLAYLPHSGFHNQLIALENALLLAAYLNRTLLLPPLYMGRKKEALVWTPPQRLLDQWASRNRTNVEYCRDVDPASLPQRSREELKVMTEEQKRIEDECRVYHAWTMVPWTYFLDIPKTLAGVVGVGGQTEPIRVFDRPVMSLEWLTEHLQIKDPIQDIYIMNDTARYDYRIVDDSLVDYGVKPEFDPSTAGMTLEEIAYRERYERTVLLTDLERRPEKVLHLQSLFARDRVETSTDGHRALQSYILHGLEIWNKVILEATSLAEKQIDVWRVETGRAAPGFLGVHFRTRDRLFEREAQKNLQRIVSWTGGMEELNKKYLKNYVVNNKSAAESRTPPQSPESPAEDDPEMSVTSPDALEQESVPTFLERCQGSPPGSPMVFMATDVFEPRRAPLLLEFLEQYPCTMFLSDFTDSVTIIEEVRNPVDGVRMFEYIISLTDANLAAKGREFRGTDKSTFTNYIKDYLWPRYHPGHTIDLAE
ncbi:hypothetical protein EDD21DRAFT_433917 [Dissophora ornata]|nr:hypothetical protein BGZ58_003865 [Dissophora ornata]KAI8605064.1 hypothetical protein EDD21DRAFT_433917 [Dissophora ornata]